MRNHWKGDPVGDQKGPPGLTSCLEPMVNKPLIRPYFLGGARLGGVGGLAMFGSCQNTGKPVESVKVKNGWALS